MRILVKSKKDIDRIILSNPSYLNDDSGVAFIMISGLLDDENAFPVEKESKNVLHCVFDDITKYEYNVLQDKSRVKLFSKEEAKRIKCFVEENKDKKMLFINCQAGISRSGAIGEAINGWINRDGDAVNGDSIEFYSINKQIQPNHFVFKIMREVLEGKKDYNSIFGEKNVKI